MKLNKKFRRALKSAKRLLIKTLPRIERLGITQEIMDWLKIRGNKKYLGRPYVVFRKPKLVGCITNYGTYRVRIVGKHPTEPGGYFCETFILKGHVKHF